MQRLPFFLLVLFALLATFAYAQQKHPQVSYLHGGIVRGDSTKKNIALVFTADEFGEGLSVIHQTLQKQNIKGSFFFTGRFYRTAEFKKTIHTLYKEGHYFGLHSDNHLLYCDWKKRDSLLVTRDSFDKDIHTNLLIIIDAELHIMHPHYFIPPYEWWNDSIATWSHKKGLTVVSYTPGIRTNADYTWPELGAAYKSNEWIMNWLKETIRQTPDKFNGAILLVHAGTDPRRKEKLYNRLEEMITLLKKEGYQLHRIDSLLRH